MLQWHHKAVEPGRGRPQRPVVHLPPRPPDPGEAGRLGRSEMDRPLLDLTWDYPVKGPLAEPDAEAVLAEINGWDADGKPLSAYTELKDDGSTACGCWIYCGVLRRRRQPGRPPQARARAELGRARVGLGLAGQPAHPLQPRLRRPRRQAVERAQGARLVGRGRGQVDRPRRPRLRPGQGARTTGRRTDATGAGRRCPAPTRSSCRPTARRGCTRRPGWSTGRCRRTTSRRSRRSATRCTRQQRNPARQVTVVRAPGQPVPAERRRARLARSSRTWSRPTG